MLQLSESGEKLINGVEFMRVRISLAERRAFNDGLQAAILAICIEEIDKSPLCANDVDDVCAGCSKLLSKQKELVARLKALKYGP